MFTARLSAQVPTGWIVNERLTLRRNGSGHIVQSACTTAPAHIGQDAWRDRLLREAAATRAGAFFTGTVAGPVLNTFDGEIVTLTWNSDGTPMVTKIGLAVHNGFGYSVLISLPQSEQQNFPSLARQARVAATVA
jgi:hypothetical protein